MCEEVDEQRRGRGAGSEAFFGGGGTFTDFCGKNTPREKPFLQPPPCSTFQPIREEITGEVTGRLPSRLANQR